MAWQPTIYSFLGFGAVFLCAIIVRQAWEYRNQRGAYSFLGMVLVGGGWSFVYGVQLGFTTAPEQLLWQRAGIAISGVIPPLLLLFTLKYAGRDGWLTRGAKVVLVAQPVVFAVLTFTNPVHGLIWDEAVLTETGWGSVLDLSLGVGYYLHIVYAYLLIAIGLGLIFHVFTQESRIYRKQSGILMLGFFPPFITHISFSFQVPIGPLPGLDPTPFFFVATGTLLVLALFQFDLLERTPIARERVIEEMGDGLIVLDSDGRVVDTNPVARQVFDISRDVSGTVDEVTSNGDRKPEEVLESLNGRTVTATIDGKERSYDLDWTSLDDHRGVVVSHVVSLRDVTDRKKYEKELEMTNQRLEVANRVLRHNLRNDMNVILGRAERLAQEEADDESKAAQRIVETAKELVDLSEKAQSISQIEGSLTSERATVEVRDRIRDTVGEFRKRYPETEIECELPEDETVEIAVPKGELFDIPVRNVIENAVEHNDTEEPWVRITVEKDTDGVHIRVEDNGNEIPMMERNVFEDATEAPVRHGSGMGLWLTYWSVRSVGGGIEFGSRNPTGNVVTLNFPG